MKSAKAFNTFRHNGLHLTLPNGNWISTIWGPGTYSENRDKWKQNGFDDILDSNTVEIMFTCGARLKKKILKKYNEGAQDPIGHLTFRQWLEIVNLLAKQRKV